MAHHITGQAGPEDGFEPEPGHMPLAVHEFTRDQLALALGESRAAANWLLTVAWHLGPVNTMGPNYRTGSPR